MLALYSAPERVVRGWINPGASGYLMITRLGFTFLFVLPLVALCNWLDHGLLGLLVFVVGLWPFPFRFALCPSGLRVSWMLFSHTVAFDDITGVECVLDSRKHVLGRAKRVLRIKRRRAGVATISGDPADLEWLAGEIGRRA